MIHYAVTGQGTLHNSGGTFHLDAGHGFITFPNEEVTYIADKDNPWHYYWVGFSGSVANHLVELADLSPENPLFHLPDIDETAKCLQDIYDSCTSSLFGEIRALGYLLIFLTAIASTNKSIRQKEKSRSPMEEYVAKALFHLEKDSIDNVNVKTLADQVGVNRSHLFRSFKSVLNISPQQYILEMRIQRACQLLTETQMSISDVAQAVGFSTNSQMGVAFKKIMHITPSRFRNQMSVQQKKNRK